MTRWVLRIAATALVAVGGIAAGYGATAHGASSTVAVPVSGTTASGGTFAGTMTVTGATVQNGRAVALGAVSGTLRDAAENRIGTVNAAPVAAPVSGDPCTLASFSLGPFDVSVLGIGVHVDPIAANVTLSGLLGSLLCPLLSGVGGGTTT